MTHHSYRSTFQRFTNLPSQHDRIHGAESILASRHGLDFFLRPTLDQKSLSHQLDQHQVTRQRYPSQSFARHVLYRDYDIHFIFSSVIDFALVPRWRWWCIDTRRKAHWYVWTIDSFSGDEDTKIRSDDYYTKSLQETQCCYNTLLAQQRPQSVELTYGPLHREGQRYLIDY